MKVVSKVISSDSARPRSLASVRIAAVFVLLLLWGLAASDRLPASISSAAHASENDQVAKARLMKRWSLSEIQADRILDMKLRQLTKLDELAIQKELSELEG